MQQLLFRFVTQQAGCSAALTALSTDAQPESLAAGVGEESLDAVHDGKAQDQADGERCGDDHQVAEHVVLRLICAAAFFEAPKEDAKGAAALTVFRVHRGREERVEPEFRWIVNECFSN